MTLGCGRLDYRARSDPGSTSELGDDSGSSHDAAAATGDARGGGDPLDAAAWLDGGSFDGGSFDGGSFDGGSLDTLDGGSVDGGRIQPADGSSTGDAGGLRILGTPTTAMRPLARFTYDPDSTAGGGEIWSLDLAPTGMTIDIATGLVGWTAPSTSGSHDVVIRVDASAETATQAFSIAVVGPLNGLRVESALSARALASLRGASRAPLAALGAIPAPARDVVRYAIECALPPGESAVLAGAPVEGVVGLAPQWAHRACDRACREWVSACLVARMNARGERVAIELRGTAPSIARSAPTDLAFEGAYYGDLFTTPAIAWRCRGDLAPRACEGRDGHGCAIRSSGACPDACDGERASLARCTSGDLPSRFDRVVSVYR
jgi:hypothetical protein